MLLDIRDMDELTKRASDSATRFAKLSQTIKDSKEAFGKLEAGVPKIKDLNQEYSTLLKKKKDAYAVYRRIKKENKELQIAKHNLKWFLNQQKEEQKQKTMSLKLCNCVIMTILRQT